MLDMPTPRTLHLLDSIALITPEMADGVVVTGSHGGSSGRFERLKERAMEYAWMLGLLGMKY